MYNLKHLLLFILIAVGLCACRDQCPDLPYKTLEDLNVAFQQCESHLDQYHDHRCAQVMEDYKLVESIHLLGQQPHLVGQQIRKLQVQLVQANRKKTDLRQIQHKIQIYYLVVRTLVLTKLSIN